MLPIIYFAHPVNTYGTPLEKELLDALARAFPDCEVLNPNAPEHDKGYREWKERTGRGMQYFYREVLPACSSGVFLAFRDGKWPKGVFGEAENLAKRGCPIFQIFPDGTIAKIELAEVEPLTVDETRARIRLPNGESRPY